MSATYTLEHLINLVLAYADEEYDQASDELLRLTKPELASICAQAIAALGQLDCVLCGVDTGEIGEYYMTTDKIWRRHGPAHGCLCIGCLEQRMGRKLRRSDFKDVPLNTEPDWSRSGRLLDRLGLPAEVAS